MLKQSAEHYDFTTAFDRAVPLMPGWVFVYLICYIFWFVNYIMIARIGKEHCMRFVAGEVLSRLVCGVFFFLLPTTNIRPEIVGNGVAENLLRWVYAVDAPTNLFPSIHCLVSWFCFIGIRGQKQIPKWYRWFSCIFAIVVFISTQTTKQHYFIDIIGAVIIAEGTYYFAMHTNWYRYLENVFDCLTSAIFRERGRAGKRVKIDE